VNKQEALEAILTNARRYEHSHEEVRKWSSGEIEDALLEAARDLDRLVARRRSDGPFPRGELVRLGAQFRDRLTRLAGAALELLIDEVEVVEGRALEEWLGASGDFHQSFGETYGSASRPEPTPVNGGIVGKAPVVIHYTTPPPSPPQIIVVPDGRRRA
jgi:hypothetical protein